MCLYSIDTINDHLKKGKLHLTRMFKEPIRDITYLLCFNYKGCIRYDCNLVLNDDFSVLQLRVTLAIIYAKPYLKASGDVTSLFVSQI